MQPYDFENTPVKTKTLRIKVRNTEPLAGGNELTEVLIIITDINDNAPVLQPKTSSITIPENTAIGKDIAKFNASDADSGMNAQFR